MSTLLITHSHHIDPITCSFAQNLLHYPPLYRFRGPSRPQTSEYALNGASLITPCGVVVNHHMVELEAVSFDFSLGQPNPTHIPTNSHRTTQLNTCIFKNYYCKPPTNYKALRITLPYVHYQCFQTPFLLFLIINQQSPTQVCTKKDSTQNQNTPKL